MNDKYESTPAQPHHVEAMERAWLWMENQADGQSKGGHATFDLMMLREERDALRTAIDALRASHGQAPASVLHLVHSAFAEIAMAFPKAFALHKVGLADTAVRKALATPTPQAADTGAAQGAVGVPSDWQKDRLLAALERAAAAEFELRLLVDECDNDCIPGWEERMSERIASANRLLAATTTAQGAGITAVGDIARWIGKAQAELDGVETDDQNNCLKAAHGALTNALKVLEAAAPQPAPPADSVLEDAALPEWWPSFIRGVCEITDRSSPEDEPEAIVATPDELAVCALNAIDAARKQGGSHDL